MRRWMDDRACDRAIRITHASTVTVTVIVLFENSVSSLCGVRLALPYPLTALSFIATVICQDNGGLDMIGPT